MLSLEFLHWANIWKGVLCLSVLAHVCMLHYHSLLDDALECNKS